MVELAELLQAGVVDTIQRMNFPSRHPLRQGDGVVREADVILSLENPLLWSAVCAGRRDFGAAASSTSRLKPGAKVDHHQLTRPVQPQQLPGFRALPGSGSLDRRGRRRDASRTDRASQTSDDLEPQDGYPGSRSQAGRGARQSRRAGPHAAAFGWNESPISTARVAAELWAQIKDKDWSLVSRSDGMAELGAEAVELREVLPPHRSVRIGGHRL